MPEIAAHEPGQEVAGTARASGASRPSFARRSARSAGGRRLAEHRLAPDRRARDGSAGTPASRRPSSTGTVEHEAADGVAQARRRDDRRTPAVRQLRSSPRRAVEPQPPQRLRESLPRQTQLPRRRRAAPAVPGERGGDRALLERAARRRRAARRPARPPAPVLLERLASRAARETRPRAGATTASAAIDVLQLAHVAGPVMPAERGQRIRRRAPRACPCRPSSLAPERLRQQRHVFDAIAQGGTRMRTTASRNSRSSRNAPRAAASASGTLVAATSRTSMGA